jgi:Ca-activated chloride channel family protein
MRNPIRLFLVLGFAGLTTMANASQVKLDVSLANPVLIAGKKQTTYLKVGLTGFEMSGKAKRTPANIAIVIDRSGSMQGDKIKQARNAALAAVNRLNANDIVSIIAYDDTVSVLVPATKASDRTTINAGIKKIKADGSTALFAGVSKGAEEVRKFLSRDRVNRVILLSDGLANVGPNTPGALGDLGASLAKDGISVTTLGLGTGYNEDLMTQLAQKSDGNHSFVECSSDLVKIFNCEFGDVLSVVAQEVSITIKCRDGIRPVKVLGRTADIIGQKVTASINQLYSNQEKYLLLEVEVPAGMANQSMPIADVSVSYANMETKTTDRLASSVDARFSTSEKQVAKKCDKKVMTDAVMQVATARNMLATELRDKGKKNEAEKLLISNAEYLTENARQLDSDELMKLSEDNKDDAKNLSGSLWHIRRKDMRSRQYKVRSQQSY